MKLSDLDKVNKFNAELKEIDECLDHFGLYKPYFELVGRVSMSWCRDGSRFEEGDRLRTTFRMDMAAMKSYLEQRKDVLLVELEKLGVSVRRHSEIPEIFS
jgi:hypothetical protein